MRLQKQAIVLILIVCEACTLSTSYMINEYMLPTNLDLKAYYVDHHPPRTQEQIRYVGRRHSNTIRVGNFRTHSVFLVFPTQSKKSMDFFTFILQVYMRQIRISWKNHLSSCLQNSNPQKNRFSILKFACLFVFFSQFTIVNFGSPITDGFFNWFWTVLCIATL